MRLNEIKTHAQCETKETHRAAEMPFRQPQSLAFDCDADGLSPLTSQRRSLGAYFSLSFFIIVPPPLPFRCVRTHTCRMGFGNLTASTTNLKKNCRQAITKEYKEVFSQIAVSWFFSIG